MNPIKHLRRFAAVLTSLAAGLVAFGATAALAMPVPDPGAGYTPVFARPVPIPGTEFRPSAPVPGPARTVTHTVVMGGMPGWQITLIALGAALAAAAVTIVLARARAGHRTVPSLAA